MKADADTSSRTKGVIASKTEGLVNRLNKSEVYIKKGGI
jgi:hypothetical protein